MYVTRVVGKWAYRCWELRGRPAGSALDDWLIAERLLHELIEEVAYFHWLNRGRPIGDPDTDWFAAEAEIINDLPSHGALDRILDERLRQEFAYQSAYSRWANRGLSFGELWMDWSDAWGGAVSGWPTDSAWDDRPAAERDLELEHTPVGGGAGPDMPGLPPVGRYLLGRFPDTVRPGRVFSLLVSVVLSGGAPLKPFEVPAGGQRLALIIDAPGLRVLGDHRQTVLVPPYGDSEPVKFDLIGDDPGPRRVSVTAWDGGSYLGELTVEVSVEHDGPVRPDREKRGEVREERTNGEVTLLVRYDPYQKAYRFEFIDVDYPEEVLGQLVYDPGPAVERLVRSLDALVEGTAGYSAAATRAYLVNEGVSLWQELVPERLRVQFWERQHRITQLTILTNRDAVPWELLYPKDRYHDAGFLVEQFPVTRAIYGRPKQRRLRLQPARFVVPPGSPANAKAEAKALARLLGTKLTTLSELMPLLQLIGKGRFGLLHFACHNRFDPEEGSSIKLDSPFTPRFLAVAVSDQTLARTAPVVFINACRSLGQVPSYNKLDGFADKFMRAGAAAFIGSLWEVSDGMAREFAQELYRRLVDGDPLGRAVMAARRAVAAEPGDPTWLAYAVYGDPQARIDLAGR